MKYAKQFSIIIVISFIGEMLNQLLPLPVPGSVYGLVLMFLCLKSGVVKLASIKETALYLVEIMPMMFIPAGVGLMDSWSVLRPSLFAYLFIVVVSTFVVMAAAGHATQAVIRLKKGGSTNGK